MGGVKLIVILILQWSVKQRLLYPWGRSLCYPLNRKLGEPQRWSKYFGNDKNLSLQAIES